MSNQITVQCRGEGFDAFSTGAKGFVEWGGRTTTMIKENIMGMFGKLIDLVKAGWSKVTPLFQNIWSLALPILGKYPKISAIVLVASGVATYAATEESEKASMRIMGALSATGLLALGLGTFFAPGYFGIQ